MNPIIIGARLLFPLLIFRWPLVGGAIAIWLDNVDWHHKVYLGVQPILDYQPVDKVLDLYYLSILFFLSLSWKNKTAQNISIALFAYRVIGVVLFEITHIRAFLFYFPNIFENFLFTYILIVMFLNVHRMFTSKFSKHPINVLDTFFHMKKMIEPRIPLWSFALIIFIVAIPKMIQEYAIHIVNHNVTLEILGYDFIYQGTNHQILYVLVFAAVSSLLLRRRRAN